MRQPDPSFTLIELLIVIAVIAILSSLLLPSLNSSVRKALAISCASNMKSIGSAEHMYLGDFDYVVPYNYKPRENGSVSPEVPFTHALNGGIGDRRSAGPYGVYFQSGIGKGGTYKCPAEKREPNFGPVGVWPHGHYGGNTNLHAHLIPSSEEEWTEMRTKFRKSSFSLQPGSTISFGDIGLLYKNGAIEVNPCRDAVSTISYFNYRHGVGDSREMSAKSLGDDSMPPGMFPKGTATILYFDGHTAFRTADSLYFLPEPPLYPGTNRYSRALVQGLQKQ